MSLTKRVLLALVLGMLIGILLSAFGSMELIEIARKVEPLGTLWTNAIRMTVIPLVVASLISALSSSSDARLASRVGGLAAVIFLGLLTATAVVTVLIAPPLLARLQIDPAATQALLASTSSAAEPARLQTFGEWLVALVPSNPIRAAADGSMLALIIASVLIGAASAQTSAGARTTISSFFGAVSDAMLRLMHWILLLAPIGVFALALPLATRLGAAAAGAVVYYIVLVSLMSIVVGLLLYPLAATVGGVPMRKFAAGCAQAQAVASTSRSSLASLPAMIEGAETKLGLNPAITRFFLPLAASTFRIGAVIGQTAGVLFLARLYGVDISTTTSLTIAFTSVLTSFSVPGVPGGSIFVMVPVLLAAGVPVEGVGILLGVDAIPDVFRTTSNVTGHMAGATIISRFLPANAISAAVPPANEAPSPAAALS